MRRIVFVPLGMTRSGYVWKPQYDLHKAYGHRSSGRVAERIRPSQARMSDLHTTTSDYAKFLIAAMNGTGLKRETSREMLKPQISIDESCISCIGRAPGRLSSSISWGLGWALEHRETGNLFWHWGENRGEFQTFVMGDPKQKLGIVIFTNSGNGFAIIPEIVSQAIGGNHPSFSWMGYDLYNSPTFMKRQADNRLAKSLYDSIIARGSVAIAEYKKNRAATGTLNERSVNSIGYWLLEKTRYREAIEVFELNVEDHPSSANAYDSLGEAYMVNGNKDLAIKNYQKSLELNSQNTNAVEMLRRLRSH